MVAVSGTNVLHLGILDWHEGSVKIEHLVIVLKHDLSACEGKGWLGWAALSHSCTYFGLSRPGHTKITGFWCLLGALDQTRAGPLWQCHLCSLPTWCHRWGMALGALPAWLWSLGTPGTDPLLALQETSPAWEALKGSQAPGSEFPGIQGAQNKARRAAQPPRPCVTLPDAGDHTEVTHGSTKYPWIYSSRELLAQG